MTPAALKVDVFSVIALFFPVGLFPPVIPFFPVAPFSRTDLELQ